MIKLDFLPVPIDVIIGFLCLILFGMIFGAIIYLPVAQKNSELTLEKLSNDLIWNYAPQWLLAVISCIIFLVISFMLISGMWRM